MWRKTEVGVSACGNPSLSSADHRERKATTLPDATAQVCVWETGTISTDILSPKTPFCTSQPPARRPGRTSTVKASIFASAWIQKQNPDFS